MSITFIAFHAYMLFHAPKRELVGTILSPTCGRVLSKMVGLYFLGWGCQTKIIFVNFYLGPPHFNFGGKVPGYTCRYIIMSLFIP